MERKKDNKPFYQKKTTLWAGKKGKKEQRKRERIELPNQ